MTSNADSPTKIGRCQPYADNVSSEDDPRELENCATKQEIIRSGIKEDKKDNS